MAEDGDPRRVRPQDDDDEEEDGDARSRGASKASDSTDESELQRERDEARRGLVVEEKGRRGGGGILRAAEQVSFEDDFSDLDPDEAEYEMKLRARQVVINGYPLYKRPQVSDLVESIIKQPDGLWLRGAWVEYLGSDMNWRVAQVRRVVRQAPDSWDWTDPANDGREPPWEYFYNVGKQTLLPGKSMRATEEGLKVIFGSRPWVWQQYALLRLEKFMRFQKDHERDFVETDAQKFAEDLYDDWLADPRNAEFKEAHDARAESVREQLREHLLSPFLLMDSITEDEEVWDWENKLEISVYTYLSVMGTGSTFAILCLAIQLVIPFVLLVNALVRSPRFDANFSFADVHVNSSWEELCNGEGNDLGKVLNVAVLLLYLLTVIPESLLRFYNRAGDADTTASRINSLREVVWSQGDDDFLQMLGFKMDRYMNSAYVVLLYGVMLFILFNTTEEILDIVLNALAADFVHRADEVIVDQDWFDPGRRWLMAGTVQLVMQATLRLRVMQDMNAFCKKYDIDPGRYVEACGLKRGSPLPRLYDWKRAYREDNEPRWKSPEDSLFFLAAEYAKEKGNPQAYSQFKKRVRTFSLFDRFANALRRRRDGVFHKYEAYRCWALWDKLLFLSKVPTRTEVRAARAGKVYVPNLEGAGLQFLKHVALVLSGGQLVRDVTSAAEKGMWQRVPFHVFDGIVQIMAYAIQLSFPVLILAALVFIPACY